MSLSRNYKIFVLQVISNYNSFEPESADEHPGSYLSLLQTSWTVRAYDLLALGPRESSKKLML